MPKVVVGSGPIRQIYRPSTGVGAYVISGSEAYFINADWKVTLLGSVALGRNNIASIVDNGILLVFVDGSQFGWTFPIRSSTFTLGSATIAAAGANFQVGDTFLLAGGTFSQAAGGTVLSVGAGGAVTGIQLPAPNGVYSVPPGNPIGLQSTSGSGTGLTLNGVFGPGGWTQIVDPTGLFVGADKVDVIDTFIVFNIPGGQTFGATLSNQVTPFNGLNFAGKSGYPDPLKTLVVNRHELILFGIFKSEPWYDSGNAFFPFAELPGAYIEHGIAAIYSVATQDIATYWLAQNLQGEGIVLRYRGYITTRISNHALEYAIRQMILTVGVDDAIGYTYQFDGHVFYVLHFPRGNQTWVWDESVGEPDLGWHQEAWTDPADGSLNRHRGNCAAFVNGVNVCGDWENGTIYQMDPNTYTDTVNESKGPMSCVRTFPHIGAASAPNGQLVEYGGRRMNYRAFVADFEVGDSTVDFPAQTLSLRFSDNRGKTWSENLQQSAGAEGDYAVQPVWRNLGMARYRVFELSHSIDGPATLNGAWVDVAIEGT